MASNFEFGLEDLYTGIHTNRQSIGSIKGISNLLKPIVEKNPDVTSYAMEAMNCLGDSDKFGLYATQAMEQLNTEYAILKKVKDKYGIESLNLNKFGREEFDVKEVAKKVWAAIVAAFRKLIQAVANFLRSVANFFGSAIAKFQVGLVEKYKNAKNLNDKNKVTGLEKPAEKMEEVFHMITQFIKAEKTTVDNVFKKETDFNDRAEMQHIAAAVPKLSKGGTLINPRKTVFTLVFGDENIKTSKDKLAGEALKNAGGIEILGKSFLASLQHQVTNGKELIKELNLILKKAEVEAKSVLTGASYVNSGKDKDSKTSDYIKEGKKDLSKKKSFNFARNVCSYSTGLLLNAFSAGLKLRSFAAAAVRAMLKKEDKK
jgi:hypothetical protein